MSHSFSRKYLRNTLAAIRAVAEEMESRRLLAVSFTAAAPVTPTNRTDVALGTMGGFVPIEPFVRVNPTDPANIAPTSHIGTRLSTNGGATFASTVTFANPPGTNTFNGDCGMAFDAAGRLYWVNIAGTGTGGISVSRINPTTGASFSTVAISNSNDDKPFIAADANAASPFANNVYVVWTRFSVSPAEVFFSRSTNLGVSSVPVQLSQSSESFTWPSSVGVAPNGDVYVAYHANGTFSGTSGTTGRVLVRRSTDGGVTFAAATQAFLAGQADVTANVQTAPGTGTIPGTQFWTQGSAEPWILPDPSRAGNIYCVANDDPDNVFGSGDNGDIVFARSTDNGVNWTRSTIVTGPSNSFQLFPNAAIDKFGNIVVAWYDNRRGLTNGSGRFKLDIMATYSIDGGLTWAPEFMVNDPSNPFDPDPGAVNRFTGPPPTTRIGEYFGIDIFGGTAHIAWNGNTFSGATPVGQQVWYDNFAISGALTVSGDDAGTTADTITVQDTSGNSNYFEVLVNGVRQYAGLKSAITGLTINGGGDLDTISIDGLSGVPITIDTGLGFDNVTINPDNSGTITAKFTSTQDLNSLTIGSGGTLSLTSGGGKVIKTKSLSVAASGKLDLTDNALIVDYTGATALSTIVSQISSASRAADSFGNASWSGASGITSTSAALSPFGFALGVVDNSALGAGAYSTFFTQTVDSTSILVRYTRNGDVNLSGTANSADFTVTAANFNQSSGQTWVNGDFNFNGNVNATDFNALASNFGLTAPPSPPAPAAGALPAGNAAGSLFSDKEIASDADSAVV